ncbi:MAG TPA: MOSC domain-containing protein [Sphingobium sp.]
MPTLDLAVDALLTGTPRPLAAGVMSAMAKAPVTGPVRIDWLGLDGDAVADPIHHGGHDKALHLYPQDHYGWWRERLGDHPLLDAPGAFGENVAVSGGVDADFCLGDRFTLGSAIVEVSHGRQPCAKLNHRFGKPDILATVVKTGRAGFYFRVIRTGEAQSGDRLTLVERPLAEWPMTRVFTLLIAGGHKRDPAGVAALATMPVLAEAWASRARELAR